MQGTIRGSDPEEVWLYHLLQKFPGYTADAMLAEPAHRIERWLLIAHAEHEADKLKGR